MHFRMTPLIQRVLISAALITATFVAGIHEKAMAENEADVIVYGSTPGGFCAAIAAAREGASVILLEPTDHVGAMNTGGLSHCDSNQMVRSTVMGLFDEWHTRVVKDYTDRGSRPLTTLPSRTSRAGRLSRTLRCG
jgi:ribulose 1,5-bisphosphate synthetase/thiazole synthase